MRTEFIYSVAALAVFPLMGNAQVQAGDTYGDKSTKLSSGAWLSDTGVTLKQGKYTLSSDALTGGKSGCSLKVKVTNGKDENRLISEELTFNIGDKISVPFELTTETEVYVYVTAVNNSDTNIKISKAKFTLNFDFAAVANKLMIEYNKLSTALGTYDYADVQTDINTYSTYYDRILAISSANYDFYKANTESIQDLWKDQSDVTGMALFGQIQNAITASAAKELDWLDGNDNLAGLNARYGNLDGMYVTSELVQAKNAAEDARNAFESEASAANLTAVKAAIADYKTKLEAQEQIKADNEDAYAAQLALLAEVYGGTDSYYDKGILAVNTYAQTFADAADRFNELIAEAKAELAALVEGTGSAYATTKAAIDASYNALKSKAENNDNFNKIGEFKEQITRIVSDYNALKTTLQGAYEQYDEQFAAANTLTKGAADFLVGYKTAVDEAVDALKTFIETNDTKTTIANLTEDAINGLIADIATAKDEYSAQKAIYNDWKSMQTAVNGKTTDLKNAKTAIDKYAKDTKKLAEGTFKPTTIWAETIDAITRMITDITNKVDANKTNATNYKDGDEYLDALAAIGTAINDLKDNANAASDIYATINGQITTANNLKTALLDPTKDPKVDLKTLDVWDNQVTTDAAIQARTPYKTVIGAIGGITIGTDEGTIKQWVDKLAEAVNKTAQYDPESDDNTGNILGFLRSIAATPADVLKDEIATLNAIKANYQSDEQAFQAQMDAQEIAGLKNSINAKVASLEAGIEALQARIDANDFGLVKGGKLQQELDALTAIATAAKNATADANAKKPALTTQYNNVSTALNGAAETNGTLAHAEASATTYAAAFVEFTNRYNTLLGAANDGADVNTYNGLLAKFADQEAAINVLANLTDAQKTTYKNNVNAVSVEKTENNKKVTYNKDNINTFMQDAMNKEELTEAEVTKYQGIIRDLKAATDIPVTQAQRMNGLEGQLAAIDIEAAKAAVLAKDPNQQGYYYKLLTVASNGSYLKAFNDLKSKIEKDTDITTAEVFSYGDQISNVKNNVNGAAGKAEANLNFFNDENAYMAATKSHAYSTSETWYGLDDAIAELSKPEYYSSEQENQLTVLNGYYEKIEALTTEIQNNYDAGKYDGNYNTTPAEVRQEIQDLLAQYTNPVNYNSQVAADNKAIYERVQQAYTDALEAYSTIADNINAYKNLRSVEMKNATAQAQDEYDALIDFLEDYEATAKEIKDRADGAYGSVVSPTLYDKDEAYKAELEALVAQLNALKTTFLNKIEEAAGAAVEASTAQYTQAIAASKEKAKKFSATDDDLDFDATGDYDEIEELLEAITKANFDDVKALDQALLAAEDASTGITPKITAVEQQLALNALKTLRDAIEEPYSNLTGSDIYSYDDINYYINKANSGNASAKRILVNNFETYKSELQRLKEVAAQNAADTAAKLAANNAIAAAQTALDNACNSAEDFVAYSEVKAELDAIKNQLEALPTVTAANAEDVKAQAEAIEAAVNAALENLYDAEVKAITALINTANEEYITYAANHTDAENATQKDVIDAQKDALNDVMAAVALAADKPGHKSKVEALDDLANIETALNDVIRALQDANETNLNADIVSDLKAKVNSSYNNLYSVYSNYRYSGIWNGEIVNDYYAINDAITELNNYIDEKAENMAAYKANVEAKIDEIEANITALSDKAAQLKSEYDEQQAANALAALNATWQEAESAIATAQGQYDHMNGELTAYSNGSKYANKVSKLQQQIANANTILAEAKAEANEKATTAEKQSIANKAVTDVNEALTNLAANCTEIIALAKAAYIEAAIAEMQDIINAITWTDANYTNTDLTTLNGKKTAIQDIIDNANTEAGNQPQAEPTYNYWGGVQYPGVKAVLSDARAEFDEAVAELKQMIKDMSLEEDVRGHITGGDEITINDIQALTNIIANRQEAQQDLDRCDVDGNGRITVTDIIWLQYYWAFGEWPDAAAAARGTSASDNSISMEATQNGNVTRLAINLSNSDTFRAFQIGLQLPAGATVVGHSLGNRVESGWLMHSNTEDNSVRFMTIADKNQAFSGNEGAVLYVDIENLNGNVELTEAYFTDLNLMEADLLSSGNTTGILDRITQSIDNAGRQLYNLGGRVMNSLRKGINIIRNSDGSTQKVVNN